MRIPLSHLNFPFSGYYVKGFLSSLKCIYKITHGIIGTIGLVLMEKKSCASHCFQLEAAWVSKGVVVGFATEFKLVRHLIESQVRV